jgi:ATPase subunit of ABC transporter with duplicated ATPase domains
VEKYRHSNEVMARRAMVTERRVEKMKQGLTPERRSGRKVAVRFPDPPQSGRFPLDAVGLSKSYGGPPVFKHVSFDLQRGERLLVLGLNGAGKTSLLRILAGIDTPDEGEVRLGHGAALGYYAQEHEGLDPAVTAMESIREVAKAPDDLLRGVLGHFLLGGDQAHQPARTLSGGEKTKLALARLVLGRHNVLVSHDTPFVQSFEPDRVLLMPDGALDVWSEDYLDLVALD